MSSNNSDSKASDLQEDAPIDPSELQTTLDLVIQKLYPIVEKSPDSPSSESDFFRMKKNYNRLEEARQSDAGLSTISQNVRLAEEFFSNEWATEVALRFPEFEQNAVMVRSHIMQAVDILDNVPNETAKFR